MRPTSAEALKFFAWAFKNGDKMAEELDYVPMPAKVVADIENDMEGRRQGRAAASRFSRPHQFGKGANRRLFFFPNPGGLSSGRQMD